MTGKEEQNELAVPAIKASARLLLMGSHAHSSQQYFSLMSQVSLSGSCKPPTLSRSHYAALLLTTFPVQLHLSAACTPSLPLSSFGDGITSLQHLLTPRVSQVIFDRFKRGLHSFGGVSTSVLFQFSSAKT